MHVIVLLFIGAALAACGDRSPVPSTTEPPPESLAAHSLQFERGVEPVVPGVWVAIGYGLANSILIEGDDGLIVIDTMESVAAGRDVAREFRALSDKPLRAIIYTHNHTDHVFGAQAFIDALGKAGVDVEIIAHRTTEALVYRVVNEYRPILTARSLRMFGTHIEDSFFENAGIGLRLGIEDDSLFGFVPPTLTFDDSLEHEVAGVRIVLQHAPGETDDQLFAWLPDLGVVAPGDNIYRAFPNLYTIRGTPYRSLKNWSASLDRIRALPVDVLVPSHTRPVVGRDDVYKTLTDYRDGISYVHDQSVRLINKGYTADQLAEAIRLPPHLATSPFLQELYGTVEWSVRSVMAGNLGWVDGNPTTLRPLPTRERAKKMIELAGGIGALRAAAADALDAGDNQWALELTDSLLFTDTSDEDALKIRVLALERLGAAARNPNARHYYLSSALELRDGIRFESLIKPTDDMLAAIPLSYLFAAMPVSLRAEEVLDVDQRVGFTFSDTAEQWTVWLRRGVAEVRPELMSDLDLHMHGDSLMFRKMLAGSAGPVKTALLEFDFPIGNSLQFLRFLARFKSDARAPEPSPIAGTEN